LRLQCADVTVRGEVDDLTPLYDRARVLVAPTRFGAGIPFKVHHAAAHGLPVLATPLPAAQLGWTDGDELLVGADPAQLAAQACRLHEDEALWTALRHRALDRVTRDCAPGEFRRRLSDVLARCMAS
jgi:glycosyltransferase involved in cell wall biosynthesis